MPGAKQREAEHDKGAGMRRRDFLTLVAGAAAVGAHPGMAQPAMPGVGLLESGSFEQLAPTAAAFRQGLTDAGFVEGRNVRIELRWAGGHYDRLPGLAAELVGLPVAVLAATGVTAALASQKATATIPVVFHTGGDPVKFGLVASLNRPGGNVTGVVSLGKILLPKQVELLHELVPKADPIGFLANPNNGVIHADTNSVWEAARTKGVRLEIVEAANPGELDAVFGTLGQRQVGALIIQPDPFLEGRLAQIAALVTRHAVPAIWSYPQFAAAGGLINYGNSLAAAYRLEGAYVARILRGEKPADMPVQQSVKVEMIVNLTAAKALGLTVPPSLLARADEVIE
jgi:putative tryptophan/tyrosine transport system substrate-binding protein